MLDVWTLASETDDSAPMLPPPVVRVSDHAQMERVEGLIPEHGQHSSVEKASIRLVKPIHTSVQQFARRH